MNGQPDLPTSQPALGDLHRDLWANQPIRTERPLGVTLIALWDFVSVALSIVVGLLALSAASNGGWFAGFMGGMGCLYLISAPINLALGAGLWVLAPWARVWTIVFAVLSVLVTLFKGSLSGVDLFSGLISAAIVYYLLRPDTRAVFERPPL